MFDHDDNELTIVPFVPSSLSRVVDVLAALSDSMPRRFPSQPPVGSVLRFERTYPRRDGDKAYTYLAFRSDTGWHLTGRTNATMSWETLVDKIGDSECLLVTAYVEIPRLPENPLDTIDNPEDWFNAAFGPSTSGKHAEEESTADGS